MTRLPSREDILGWIADNPARAGRRDVARAFGLKGAARAELGRLLREMEAEGALAPRHDRRREAGGLPPVAVLEVTGADDDGDLFARPLGRPGAEPQDGVRIMVLPRGDGPALATGDRFLARITESPGPDHSHVARPMRLIGAGPRRVLGIFRAGAEGGTILPVDKGSDTVWRVPPGAMGEARDGELVEAEATGPAGRLGAPRARILARLGDPGAPRAISLIAIHQHGIPDVFPDAVLAEAEAAKASGLEGRSDLRILPFVTIDPADARDHDDAVHAHPDDDPENPDGHVVWVAIADVAAFVPSGSELDREARRRGNSTYFPDRVVPMLPERLSADLCSLRPAEDRAVIAVRMVLDANGTKIAHRFERGVIRSCARLSYRAMQDAADGQPDEMAAPLLDDVIAPLWAAWRAAARARAAREPLEIELPERRIELTEDGRVASVAFRERLEAHRLIEDFMVLANVAAAEELIDRRSPLLFRVHEEPAPEKIDALRELARASGLVLAKGQVLRTRHLNRLLAQAEGTEADELINMATLRSMSQAYYHPQNLGHFGLALKAYAHFTSPIRRYADLVVHRALIAAHHWPGGGDLTPDDVERLEATALRISEAERRSMAAERDTSDRYLAAWLAERVGSEFPGRVSGVARFGLFVKLDETGADGLVPVRSLGQEYFRHDAEAQTLTGVDSGFSIGLGARVLVRLAEAAPHSGGLLLELLEVSGKPVPRASARSRKPGRSRQGRKAARARR